MSLTQKLQPADNWVSANGKASFGNAGDKTVCRDSEEKEMTVQDNFLALSPKNSGKTSSPSVSEATSDVIADSKSESSSPGSAAIRPFTYRTPAKPVPDPDLSTPHRRRSDVSRKET